jgi:2,5-diketo-D-gluconate reductase A
VPGFSESPKLFPRVLLVRRTVDGARQVVVTLPGYPDRLLLARSTCEANMADVPTRTLDGGVSIPQLGFGVFQIPDSETADAVTVALEAGYRHIDTAAVYGNERGVGEAIAASAIPREEIFVTTKVWNADQGADATRAALERSLATLAIEYVDLYLIHWPVAVRDRYVETWRAMRSLRDDGAIHAIGVSNFEPEHLDRLLEETGVVPAVNQIELHPRLQQAKLRAYHAHHGIATEAWAPLAKGEVLDDPVIASLAERVGRTPAQVILRWHLQLGNIAIPKSVTPTRIRENLDVFDFELREEDMQAITTLDANERVGPHPDEFTG